MAVKDNYLPTLKDSNLIDKFSDKWLGTNRVHNINLANNYELQKAINVNKFEWNKQGMLQSGINPLVASGNLANVASSQAQSSQSSDMGLLGNSVSFLLKKLLPSEQAKEMKEALKILRGVK